MTMTGVHHTNNNLANANTFLVLKDRKRRVKMRSMNCIGIGGATCECDCIGSHDAESDLSATKKSQALSAATATCCLSSTRGGGGTDFMITDGYYDTQQQQSATAFVTHGTNSDDHNGVISRQWENDYHSGLGWDDIISKNTSYNDIDHPFYFNEVPASDYYTTKNDGYWRQQEQFHEAEQYFQSTSLDNDSHTNDSLHYTLNDHTKIPSLSHTLVDYSHPTTRKIEQYGMGTSRGVGGSGSITNHDGNGIPTLSSSSTATKLPFSTTPPPPPHELLRGGGGGVASLLQMSNFDAIITASSSLSPPSFLSFLKSSNSITMLPDAISFLLKIGILIFAATSPPFTKAPIAAAAAAGPFLSIKSSLRMILFIATLVFFRTIG